MGTKLLWTGLTIIMAASALPVAVAWLGGAAAAVGVVVMLGGTVLLWLDK